MKNNNMDLVDDISFNLMGLIAMFDLIGTSKADGLRHHTVSEFSCYVMRILQDMHEKVNSISLDCSKQS